MPRLAVAALLAASLAPGPPVAEPERVSLVVVIPVRGMIQAATEEFVRDALGSAAERQAALVVLLMDTPGGYMSSMEAIQASILSSAAPVAVLVAPAGAGATSAGFFLLMTADVAAMAPGTTAGAAHPIRGGEEIAGQGERVVDRKLEEYAAARIRSMADKRGRNVEAAEKAVRQSVSYTDQEALAAGLVEHVVPDVPRLLEALHGKTVRRFDSAEGRLVLAGARVETVHMTTRQAILAAIGTPQVAYLLFLVGLLGVYVEISHPGLILPAVVGALCLLLGLYATTVLTVSVAGVLLVLLGVSLLVLEAFFTSYGVLGMGGVTALLLGSLMLFPGPLPGLELNLLWVLPAVGAFALVVLALASLVLRTRSLKVSTGKEALAGSCGTALGPIGPEGGRILVQGEYWSAWSREPIQEGQRVRVRAVSDLLLEVEPDRPEVTPCTGPKGG